MSMNESTAPELYPSTPGAQIGESGSIYDELLEKIVSGKMKLSFSYLPPRAVEPENLNIYPIKFPLVDPNKPPERIIYL